MRLFMLIGDLTRVENRRRRRRGIEEETGGRGYSPNGN